MEPLDYLRILGRRWRIIVAVIAIGAIAAFVTTPKPKSHTTQASTAQLYKASETLLVDTNALDNEGESLARTTFLVTVGDIPKRAAVTLHYKGDPQVLANAVVATADSNVGTIVISATEPNATTATQTASAFATAMITDFSDTANAAYTAAINTTTAQVNDMQKKITALDKQIATNGDPLLSAQRTALGNQYQLLIERYQSLAVEPPPTNPFTVVQTPTASPAVPASTSHGIKAPASRKARVLIAVLLGLLLGGALSLLLERIDTRVRTKEGAEEAFGLPVIAEIPTIQRRRRRFGEVTTATQPASPFAEAYRILRTSILFLRQENLRQLALPRSPQHDNGNGNGSSKLNGGADVAHFAVAPAVASSELHTVLVTSPGPSEGKTTSVANLAAAFAEAGQSVLVLTCDLRRPRIQAMLEVESGPGLSDVLSGRSDAPTLAEVARPTSLRGVWLVTSGTDITNPAELLSAERGLIADARALADVVIIDTPPVLAANDASELAAGVDVVILVARAGKTTREAAERTTEVLGRLGAPVLGVALVGAPRVPTARRYYYRYQAAHGGIFAWRRLFKRRRQPVEGPRAETLAPTRPRSMPVPGDGGGDVVISLTSTESSVPADREPRLQSDNGISSDPDDPRRWRHRARSQPAVIIDVPSEDRDG